MRRLFCLVVWLLSPCSAAVVWWNGDGGTRPRQLRVCCACGSDMADNWDIDVAKELEDYLEELETVTISFDGGKTNLNFAEAALLIQVW